MERERDRDSSAVSPKVLSPDHAFLILILRHLCAIHSQKSLDPVLDEKNAGLTGQPCGRIDLSNFPLLIIPGVRRRERDNR